MRRQEPSERASEKRDEKERKNNRSVTGRGKSKFVLLRSVPSSFHNSSLSDGGVVLNEAEAKGGRRKGQRGKNDKEGESRGGTTKARLTLTLFAKAAWIS